MLLPIPSVCCGPLFALDFLPVSCFLCSHVSAAAVSAAFEIVCTNLYTRCEVLLYSIAGFLPRLSALRVVCSDCFWFRLVMLSKVEGELCSLAGEPPCIIDGYTPAPVVPDIGTAAPFGGMLLVDGPADCCPVAVACCLLLLLVLFLVFVMPTHGRRTYNINKRRQQ